MTRPLDDTSLSDAAAKPAYRVPIGLPIRGDGKEGIVVSVLVHTIIILLILFPVVIARTVIQKIEQGAGGPGPAGGGGGRRVGSGPRETLRYVRIAPQQVPTPTTIPPITPPIVPKVQLPEVKPPTPTVPEQTAVAAPVAAITSIPGLGTGRDGTDGTGPGSGGGVGSGDGTGRGSGRGPGTGGGTQANYPPTPKQFFLPPMPPPASVKGFKLLAEFDVDSTGRVLRVDFTQTRDGDYNRRLEKVLNSMKFNPGTRPDGTPLRMKAQVGYEF